LGVRAASILRRATPEEKAEKEFQRRTKSIERLLREAAIAAGAPMTGRGLLAEPVLVFEPHKIYGFESWICNSAGAHVGSAVLVHDSWRRTHSELRGVDGRCVLVVRKVAQRLPWREMFVVCDADGTELANFNAIKHRLSHKPSRSVTVGTQTLGSLRFLQKTEDSQSTILENETGDEMARVTVFRQEDGFVVQIQDRCTERLRSAAVAASIVVESPFGPGEGD
jgi:hypothetical protein